MSHYLLRMEGVNLDRFVLDTRDLSTIRGGSLLLLDAVVNKAQALIQSCLSDPTESSVEKISTGASAGLFKIAVPTPCDPAKLADALTAKLAEDVDLKHATFVVDALEWLSGQGESPDDAFVRLHETLIAMNRFKQYRSSTVSVPPHDLKNEAACRIDAVRPAAIGDLSAATHRRREFGRGQKQVFYKKWSRVTGEPDLEFSYSFANEFSEIAAALDEEQLKNKLAIFYADGNGFGGLGRRLCTSEPRLKAWDTYLRGVRSLWLRTFLKEELLARSEWNKGDGKGAPIYRFETLLWGGDEVMFVMPAWLGWRFAAHFFRLAETWNANEAKYRTTPDGPERPLSDNQPLTLTAALVFCQSHAPIDRIKRLAKEGMAEFGKNLDGGRERNQLIYQVLESFDHMGSGYEAALKKRLEHSVEIKDLSGLVLTPVNGMSLHQVLSGISLGIDALHTLELPRSQLRALVNSLTAGDKSVDLSKAVEQMSGDSADLRTQIEALRQCFTSDPTFWVHLEELWDYARP